MTETPTTQIRRLRAILRSPLHEAANDMLAALREARKVTKFHNSQVDRVIRDAIAKATGGVL